MKKLVMLLVVLAIAAPALAANVDITGADAGSGVLEISYNAAAGHGPRGFAVTVTLSGCQLASAGDATISTAAFNVGIDDAYEQETATPGSYDGPGAGQNAIAAVPGPGLAAYPATTFSISLGALDTAGNQAAGPEGSNVLVALQLTDNDGDGTGTATLSIDNGRGGPVVTDNAATTSSVASAPITITFATPWIGPECWTYATQCHGDSNGDGTVETADWPAFRDGFFKTYPDAAYTTNACADYNRDGKIETADWPEFRDWFFKSPPADCPPAPTVGSWPPL